MCQDWSRALHYFFGTEENVVEFRLSPGNMNTVLFIHLLLWPRETSCVHRVEGSHEQI